MIDVQNVSMRFNLGIEKNNSLKQMAVDLFSKSARDKRKSSRRRKYLPDDWIGGRFWPWLKCTGKYIS